METAQIGASQHPVATGNPVTRTLWGGTPAEGSGIRGQFDGLEHKGESLTSKSGMNRGVKRKQRGKIIGNY